MLKKLLSIAMAVALMLSMSISALAQVQAAESQGLTGTYIKITDGVYRLDPNAPTTRYIPDPACYHCGNTRFVTAKNTFLRYDNMICGCPVYYNGHACYYCGVQYIDEEWTNHKSDCEYQR